MLRRRDTLLILLAAVIIAILAWVFLASDESNAPESGPGGMTAPAPIHLIAPPNAPSLIVHIV